MGLRQKRARYVFAVLLAMAIGLAPKQARGQGARTCASSTRFVDCFTLEDSIPLFQDASHPIVRLTHTVVTTAGHILVADASEAHIKVFRPTGGLLQIIGRKGKGPGEFVEPRLLSLSRDGRLHVMDTGLSRITVFDDRYRFVKTVPVRAEIGHVTGMIVDSLGRYRLTGFIPEGIALVLVDSAGRQVETFLKGLRGTRGTDKMWRVLQSTAIAGAGRLIYLASSTQDSLYTIDAQTKQVVAQVIPGAELSNPPRPPATFDRQGFAQWANSFYRPAEVFAGGPEIVVTIVRGNLIDGAVSVLAINQHGKWRSLSGAPLVLDIAGGTLLALLTTDPERVVLGRFRRRP